MKKPFVAKPIIAKSFVALRFVPKIFIAKAFLLLVACSSGLLMNSASAAPATTAAPVAATAAPAAATTLTATATGTAASSVRTSEVRSFRRRRRGLRRKIVISRRKEQRLSRKMAVLAETGDMKEGLGSLGKLRGRLRWPVESGTIHIPFGPYQYMPSVRCNNKGVTIAAEEGADVRAVADGRVLAIFPELDAVMISHGDYFTTYSNLSGIAVCKGDEIISGQLLGSVGPDGQMDFWLSDDKGRMLDPAKLLKR